MEEISTQDLKKLIETDKDVLVLDCRGIDYFRWGHISGAKNMRWINVRDEAPKLITDKNTLIVTTCESMLCDASTKAYVTLKELGYTNLREHSGGISEWKAFGFPVESASDGRISNRIYRFPNQSFYSEQVGSYLVEDEEFILLVDGPQNLTEEHEDFIVSFNKPIKVFLTHGPTGGDLEKLRDKYNAEIYLHKKESDNPWLTVEPDHLFSGDLVLSEGLHLIPTPGHSPGSTSLYDSRDKILLSGDHLQLKDGEIFDLRLNDQYLDSETEWLDSLRKILELDIKEIWPFHYEPLTNNPTKTIRRFLEGE